MFCSSDVGKTVSDQEIAVSLLHLLEKQVNGLCHTMGKVGLLRARVAPPSSAVFVILMISEMENASSIPDLCEHEVAKYR